MISVDTFNNKPVAVMGLGKSGISVARALDSGGAEVWAWDDEEEQRNKAKIKGLNLVNLYECDCLINYLCVQRQSNNLSDVARFHSPSIQDGQDA